MDSDVSDFIVAVTRNIKSPFTPSKAEVLPFHKQRDLSNGIYLREEQSTHV